MELRALSLLLIVHISLGLELKAQLKDQWKSFKKAHLKSYSPSEEIKRQEIFKKSVETVLQHNLRADLGEETTRLAINKFADMTVEEFSRNYLGFSNETVQSRSQEDYFVPEARENYPVHVDWRDSGFVNPVRDQLGCGSCWAFATAAVLETHYGLAIGVHVSLSEQMLLDCAYNAGCIIGGNLFSGFQYAQDKGIAMRHCYPYINQKADTCQYKSSCPMIKISHHQWVRSGDEQAILAAVATKGPLTASMFADPNKLRFHSVGVYKPAECYNQPNHAVVIAGYGTQDGDPYWLIRNSWGEGWGDRGYFKILRNANMCSIAGDTRYPVI